MILRMITDLFKPVLSDRTIMKYNRKGLLIEQPIPDSQLQPNSVDLTLGGTYKHVQYNFIDLVTRDAGAGLQAVLGHKLYIDPLKEIKYKSGEFEDKIIIQPKEFVLLASNEILNIPNGILSFVQGRSSVARIGIQTEQAGLIDAGFRGTITFEVYNETEYPIILYKGMRVAQVYFFKAQLASKVYGKEKGSKYSGQIEATGSRISNDPELDKYRNNN